MISKATEKKEAIRLRKEGKTYAEILAVVPVAKSTLSLWLRDVGMAKEQKQIVTEKKIKAQKKGAAARHSQRIDRYQKLFNSAKSDIVSISDKELFLIGTVLYWAEGNKEKLHRPGSGYQFGNMDPKMILIILEWLARVCKIPKSMVVFDLYLHRSSEHRLKCVLKYWEDILDIPTGTIAHVYYKNNALKDTNRKNIGETYFGLIRLKVPESSDLVRSVAGWTEGIAAIVNQ